MKENQLPLLFESVRSVPTEISLEQVSQTISSFPAVIRKPWYAKINLNIFLMTSSLIVITTAAIFFTSSNGENDRPSESQQIFEIERLDISDRKLSPFNPQLPNSIIYTLPEPDSILIYEEQPETEPEETSTSDSIELNDLNSSHEKPRFSTSKEVDIKDVILSTYQAKNLQNTLEDWVETDDLLVGKSDLIKIKYHPDYLIINSDTLSGSSFNRYRNLLFSFNITPGYDRYLLAGKKYLMAGDFKDGNFRGSVLGKLMDVRITKKPGVFRSGETEGRKVILHVTDIKPTNIKYKEATFIDTNRLNEPKEIRTKSDSINKSKLKELHTDIVSLFKSYDFKTKGRFRYTISFSESTLELGQRSLTPGQKRELINLLADYNIHLKDDRLLMLNDYGIMLVDEVEPMKNTFISWLKPGRIFKITGSELKEIERSFLRDN